MTGWVEIETRNAQFVSYHKGVLAYDRAKTRDRRNDNAHIEIVVPDIIKPLFRKYKGTSRVFDFYQKYSNAANFNKHINKGLHFIADELGIPRFDFYSARHTWASIARNKLGIDKYTIHEALNHVSQLDVTDIYIQKDFTNINKANEKVVEYVTELIKKTKNDAWFFRERGCVISLWRTPFYFLPFHRYEIFKKHFYLQQSPNFHKLGLCLSAKDLYLCRKLL